MKFGKQNILPFIDLTMTDKCNYCCEYCLEEPRIDRLKKHLDIQASDNVINNFMKIIKNLEGQWGIRLVGGEAMLHPRFFELAEFIASEGHNISIPTNFSFSIETYKKLVDICGDHLENICASLHLSQIKSIDNFINKVIEFNNYKNSKTEFLVVSVLIEENFEILKEIKEELNKHNIKLSFQRLISNGKLFVYNQEIEEYLNQNPEHSAKRIERLKGKNMFGTICNTGYKAFRIQQNGRVERCYTKQHYLNFLGNIESENIKLFDKPMPCLSKECQCYLDFVDRNLIELNHKNYLKAYYFVLLGKIKITFKMIKSKFHWLKLSILQRGK